MLGKPKGGWAKITLCGKDIGAASYLDWLPGIVLEACIRYLECAKRDYDRWGYAAGEYGFNLEFDGEGLGRFGIVEIGEDFYIYDKRGSEPPYVRLTELDLKPFRHDGLKFIKSLTEEVLADIKEYFEQWVIWDAVDEIDADRNREALTGLIANAEKALKELKEAEEKEYI